MRIDQFLSNLKYGSRKDVKTIISEKRVRVDGVPVTRSDLKIEPRIHKVEVDGMAVFYKDPIHIALYKPQGYLSANRDDLHPVALSLIKEPYSRFRLSIAGRLDLDAEGLLILTTDGDLLHRITHPSSHLPKTYEVRLDRPFQDPRPLMEGVIIQDGRGEPFLAKALDVQIQEDCVTIIIDEGKFHQVKRMFAAVGYEVMHLKRTRIGKLSLGELSPGEYRMIGKEELE